MSIAVQGFCHAALLKSKERLPDLLALLSPDRRAEIEEAMRGVTELSEQELRESWRRLRKGEIRGQRRAAAARFGVHVKNLSPRLQFLIGERA